MLKGLSERRPVFHSEADFQLALAWYLHEMIPNCQVRLEFKPFQSEKMYLDIWLHTLGIAMELKYVTRELKLKQEGENFVLRNQLAQDTRRYDFIRDISRLEKVVCGLEPAKTGFAVLLTNDPSYWRVPRQGWEGMSDAAFRIHEGKTVKGKMKWSERASEGTTIRKERPDKAQGFLRTELEKLLEPQRGEVWEVSLSRGGGGVSEDMTARERVRFLGWQY